MTPDPFDPMALGDPVSTEALAALKNTPPRLRLPTYRERVWEIARATGTAPEQLRSDLHACGLCLAVANQDPPLLDRERLCQRGPPRCRPHGLGAAVGERAGVGRVAKDAPTELTVTVGDSEPYRFRWAGDGWMVSRQNRTWTVAIDTFPWSSRTSTWWVPPPGLPPHHLGDRRAALTGEPVYRRADEEVRPGRVSRVEQLEDVAPPRSPMWTHRPGSPSTRADRVTFVSQR